MFDSCTNYPIVQKHTSTTQTFELTTLTFKIVRNYTLIVTVLRNHKLRMIWMPHMNPYQASDDVENDMDAMLPC